VRKDYEVASGGNLGATRRMSVQKDSGVRYSGVQGIKRRRDKKTNNVNEKTARFKLNV